MERKELETLVAVHQAEIYRYLRYLGALRAAAEDPAPLETGSGSGGSCGLLGLEAALIVAYFALRPSRSRASA
jgi:hypothetical protein